MEQPLFDLLVAQALELPLPDLTRREIAWPQMPKKVQAITGMRRAGKTTFLHQIMRDFQQGGMELEGLLSPMNCGGSPRRQSMLATPI